jgi:uncharacterized protein YyaL (SSP411 family)
MLRPRLTPWIISVLAAAASCSPTWATPPFAAWGAENLKTIDRHLGLPKRGLYAEFEPNQDGSPSHPAFMWGVGVQLSALAAAAKLEPDTYLKQATAYADAIQVYWLKHAGIEGFDVQPGPKESDRYYDDNAWLVLALSEIAEISKNPQYLDRAVATFRFVMSGEDDKLGGGLYWREVQRSSKNTCTNAPAIVSALRLYQLKKEDEYLQIAKRLYAWTNSHLQDKDGLYWDNIRLDGRVSRQKYTYNTALMIRANCLFHRITGESRYLKEAQRVALAADQKWVRENGAIADSGRFAHLLVESFLAVYQEDQDPRWTRSVEKSLVYVHEHLKTPEGRYPNRWDRPYRDHHQETALLNQASPARAFWVAAEVIKAPKSEP